MKKRWLLLAVCCSLYWFKTNAAETDSMNTLPPTADSRLVPVLARLQAGGHIKVAAIGGSITTGYATSPPEDRGWAASVARWLKQQAQAGGGKVEFLNLGVSGTDSAAAAQRVQAQAVATDVDLVIVEFGVNDQWLDASVRRQSYEGLLRQLLKAPQRPAVITLQLTQQGNRERDAADEEKRIALHYGVPVVDFGPWVAARVARGELDWAQLYDEPIHPNQRGHDAIAAAVTETLAASWQAALKNPTAQATQPPTAPLLPAPLYSSDFEFVRNLGSADIKPSRARGFQSGGDMHPEWQRRPGGAQQGWVSQQDDAEMSFLVFGRQILVFHSESEHYRNLEAWVDDGPRVTLQGYNPQRKGYLGWVSAPVGVNLDDGAHVLHIRMRPDEFAGTGRAAGVISIMTAGIPPKHAPYGPINRAFEALTDLSGTLQWVSPQDPRLLYIGRFDTTTVGAPAMAWSGSEVRARFSGRTLALRLEGLSGVGHFNVNIDGRSHRLGLVPGKMQDYRLQEALSEGVHELSLVKRSEGLLTQARFGGILIERGERLLSPPTARALRLEFYGDSITAGACNGDMGDDQYEDLVTHDGTRAYGAITAQRLGADYVGIAVSGTGITRSWNDILMPDVFDRVAPVVSAPHAKVTGPAPDLVFVNLGQNDFGFPQSRGEPFPADYAPRYVAFVQGLRARYPEARIVSLLGGMTGWRNSQELRNGFQQAVQQLQRNDAKLWSYIFQADTDSHPRVDTHERMASELVTFLKKEVLREGNP